MAGVRIPEDLVAWQLAWQLKERVFAFTARESVRTDFKFREQIRSASNSATDAICEGFYRYSPRDFARFLGIARGSLGEVKNQLRHARARCYVEEDEVVEMLSLASRAMAATTNLQTYLRNCGRK